jgi:hypothetical protein
MIVLHKKGKGSSSLQLEQKLEELVISFKTELHDFEEEGLPYIEEDGRKFQKENEIKEWLNELEAELNMQRSVSGDGCYINPNSGKVC